MKETPLAQNPELLAEVVNQIHQTPHFLNFPIQTLIQFCENSRLVELTDGEFLLKQGGPSSHIFYLLLEGSFEVFSDKKFILNLDQAGQTIGEMAVLKPDTPRTADVVAKGDAKVISFHAGFLKKDDTESLFKARDFLFHFTHILAEKLDATTRRAKLYEDAVLGQEEAEIYKQHLTTLSEDLKEQLSAKLALTKLYSQVVEKNNDAILICTPSGDIKEFNSAFKTLFGCESEKEMECRSFTELFIDISGSAEDFFSNVKGGWNGDKKASPKKGGSFPVQLSVSPILPNEKDPESLVYACSLRDITLQKEYESNIIKTNHELKQTYTELEKTLQELEQSNEAKNRFFSNITGQIKTPLVNLLNSSELMSQELGQKQISESTKNFLVQINESSATIERMVGNLVNLATMSQEIGKVTFKGVSVERFVSQVQENLGNVERIKWALNPDMRSIIIDESKFLKAFLGILELALGMHGKAANVTVEFYFSHKKSFVEIAIKVGEIEADSCDLKIDTYLDDGVEQAVQEAELQLPLAKRIIELHKGELKLHIEENSGKIEIRLPIDPSSNKDIQIKVMVIDAQPWDRQLLQGILEKLFPAAEIFKFSSQMEALNAYNTINPQLLIVDPFHLDGQWDFETFLSKLTDSLSPETSTLVISEQLGDMEVRQKVIETGVTDFMFKPYSIKDASFKIRSIIDTKQRLSQLNTNIEKAEKSAVTDAMTGLYNRGYYDHYAENLLAKAKSEGTGFAIIMSDVDNFKNYNDTNGHQLGDVVLIKIAKILQTSVREQDLASRYGGEEFVIMLPGASAVVGKKVAESIRQKVDEAPFPKEESQPLGKVTISFGVAVFPEHGETIQELLKKADDCLYIAKEQGRNKVIVYGSQ
ncbi:MAG: diguanylate cyclase [SAR324 cluster bacterium]|nr:diguanylate cyclase [SAR324 cluster bacterium]